jgi:hypothetical protein
MQLFPSKTRQQLDAVLAIGTELDKTVKSIEQKRIRDTDQGGTGLDHYDDNSKVMIVEMQWVEREVFYLIADEETQTKLQISEKQHAHMLKNAQKLQERLPGVQVGPLVRPDQDHARPPDVGQQVAEPDAAHSQHHSQGRHCRGGRCLRRHDRSGGKMGSARYDRMGNHRRGVTAKDHAAGSM